MSLKALIAVVLLAHGGAAAAQDLGDDFVLRPSHDDGIEDIWPDESRFTDIAEGGFGPPLAGPTGAEPIGPPLAGPARDVRPPRAFRRDEDGDPFAPPGFSLGTFIVRPAVEIGVTATDNAGGSADKEAAVGAIIAPELTMISEDERHSIEAALRGETILYGDEEFDEREAEAIIRARYDITRLTSLRAEAAYVYELDRYTDPDTPDAAVERPAVHEFDAELGFSHWLGPVALGFAGEAAREIHDDVSLSGGGTASRKELDNLEYGIRSRVTYESGGVLSPYAEAALGRRDFDQDVDDSGFERASLWREILAGVGFDLGSKLSGSTAIGYRDEDIEDERLEDLDGVIAAASVLWSPRRLTEVRLEFTTEMMPTSIPDASGSILYSGVLSVARQSTARLRLEAGTGLDYERFVGLDRLDLTYGGFAGMSYALSRWLLLEARYVYERTDSDAAEADSDEHIVTARIRLQR